MIKDECDIIELFVRINSSWADHFFILDNGSSDHTPHVLRRLSEEGFRISVKSDPSIQYRQGEMTTNLVREIAARGEFDFIFPIDGDEFVSDAGTLMESLALVGPDQVGLLEWNTLVPNDGSVMLSSAPLYAGFSKRRTELRSVSKAILPNDLARTTTVYMGNHGASRRDGRLAEGVVLPVPLFHVPVRSKEQIIAKAIIGSRKFSIKNGRKKGEGFHWDTIAELIRSNGFVITDEQLRDIALGYGWSAGDPRVRDTIPLSIGSSADTLKYAELSQVNLPQLLDGFLDQLCNEVLSARSTMSLTKKALFRMLGR